MSMLLRFVIGTLLMQAATAALVVAALRAPDPATRWLFAAVGAGLGVVAALWLAAMAASARSEAVARARERFSEERAALRVGAEQERARLIAEGHRRAERERRRAEGRASLKVGAAFAGVLGLGVLMLFSQLASFGLLTLAAGGGTTAGYLLRLRQERRARGGDPLRAPAAPDRLAAPAEPSSGKGEPPPRPLK